MDGLRGLRQISGLAPQLEAAILRTNDRRVLFGIQPVSAVKIAESTAAPFEIEAAALISIDLNMHDDGTRLLNSSDLAQFYPIAKSCC